MNRIIRESKWILGRSKLFTLLLFILVNSALTVTIFSRVVSSEISADADDYKKRNEDNCYYRLLDDLEGEDGKSFERSAQCTNKQFRFLAELQDSKDLEYYICGDNSSVGIVDFKGNEKTKRNYENGGSSEYVFDNIALPLKNSRSKKSAKKIEEISKRLGIYDKLSQYPYNMSGGECQRVAIARALINEPDIILADEPTGALDSKTSAEIMDLFKALNSHGRTVIIVTHDKDIASQCGRIIEISDGRISGREQ